MAATPLRDGEPKAAVREKIVRLVCAELRDTEITYASNMRMLLTKIAGPLRDDKLCTELQLSDAARQAWKACYGALLPIVNLHGEIETDLQRAISNPAASSAEMISAVVKAIESKAPFFGLYNIYIDCYYACMELVSSNSSAMTKKFSAWLAQREVPAEALQSLLIQPVQRLPRYSLFINQIKIDYGKELGTQGIHVDEKIPSASDPAVWTQLLAFKAQMHAKVTEVNEKQRTSEHSARLRCLSTSIRGLKPGYEVAEPHRRFIDDALCSQAYPKLGAKKLLQGWLCNDVLILSTELPKDSKECKLKGWIELADVISVQALSSTEGHPMLTAVAGSKDVPKLDRCIAITSRIDADTHMAAPSPTAAAANAIASAATPTVTSSGPGSARKSRKSFTPQANKSLLKNIFGGASSSTTVAYTAEASPTAAGGSTSGAFFPTEQLLILELDSEARKTQWVQQLQTLITQRDAAARLKSPPPTPAHSATTEMQAKKRLCVSSDDTPTRKSPRTKLASSPAAACQSDASLAAAAAAVPLSHSNVSPLTTPVRESSLSRQHVSPDSNLDLGSIPLDASWSSDHDAAIGSGQASANTSTHVDHSAISMGDVNISNAFDLSSAVGAPSMSSAADESMEESAVSASGMMLCIDEEDGGLVLTVQASSAVAAQPIMDCICEEGEDSITELNQSTQSTRRTSKRLSGHKRSFSEAAAKEEEVEKEADAPVAVAYTHAAQPAAVEEAEEEISKPAAAEQITTAPASALALIANIPVVIPAAIEASIATPEVAVAAPAEIALAATPAPMESSLPFASPTVFAGERFLTARPTHRRQRNGSIADLGAMSARSMTTRSHTVTPRKGVSAGLAAMARFPMSPSVLAPSSLPISAPLGAFGRLPNFLAPTVSSAAKTVVRAAPTSAASVSGARSTHAQAFIPGVSPIASLALHTASGTKTPRSAGRALTTRSANTITASSERKPTHRVTRSTVWFPEAEGALKLLGPQINSPRALGVSTRAGAQREATSLSTAQDASTPQKAALQTNSTLNTPRGHSRTASISALDCVSKLALPSFLPTQQQQQVAHADDVAGDENM